MRAGQRIAELERQLETVTAQLGHVRDDLDQLGKQVAGHAADVIELRNTAHDHPKPEVPAWLEKWADEFKAGWSGGKKNG